MVVEERIPFALICEDDVVIGRSAFPVIQKLMTMMNPSDPNVTILGNAQTYSSWGIKKVDRFHKLVRVHKSYGTYAYLISLNAAEKFIQNSLPICSSADDWLLYERQRGFQMLGVVPYCISPSFLNNMSTIGNTRHEMMRAASQSRGFSDKVAHYFKKRFSAPQLLKLLKRVKTQPMIW